MAQMTGLETSLISTLVGVLGIAVGVFATARTKVSKEFCQYQHEALCKLWDEKLKPINEKLDAILDGHGWDGRERRK